MVWIVWSCAPYSQIYTLTEMFSNKFPRNGALVHVQQVCCLIFVFYLIHNNLSICVFVIRRLQLALDLPKLLKISSAMRVKTQFIRNVLTKRIHQVYVNKQFYRIFVRFRKFLFAFICSINY